MDVTLSIEVRIAVALKEAHSQGFRDGIEAAAKLNEEWAGCCASERGLVSANVSVRAIELRNAAKAIRLLALNPPEDK